MCVCVCVCVCVCLCLCLCLCLCMCMCMCIACALQPPSLLVQIGERFEDRRLRRLLATALAAPRGLATLETLV